MILDQNQLKEAKELYLRVMENYRQRVELEVIKKDRIENLQTEIAQICEIKNKDGEPLPNKVKMPLVLAIFDELYFDKPNKKELEYELMQEYKTAIKKDLSKTTINSYTSIENELLENKSENKEIFKEFVTLSKETLNAVNLLAKEKYKELKNDKFGIESDNDEAETEAIKAELENYLKDSK